MDAGSIFLILALALIVGLFIARPFFKSQVIPGGVNAEDSHARSALLAERDRMLMALQELDFDHRLGKIPEEDYPAMRAELMQTAAQVLRRLDEMGGGQESGDFEDRIEEVIAARRADAAVARVQTAAVQAPASGVALSGDAPADELEDLIATRRRVRQEKSVGFCPKCGKPAQKSDRFCSRCGATLAS